MKLRMIHLHARVVLSFFKNSSNKQVGMMSINLEVCRGTKGHAYQLWKKVICGWYEK